MRVWVKLLWLCSAVTAARMSSSKFDKLESKAKDGDKFDKESCFRTFHFGLFGKRGKAPLPRLQGPEWRKLVSLNRLDRLLGKEQRRLTEACGNKTARHRKPGCIALRTSIKDLHFDIFTCQPALDLLDRAPIKAREIIGSGWSDGLDKCHRQWIEKEARTGQWGNGSFVCFLDEGALEKPVVRLLEGAEYLVALWPLILFWAGTAWAIAGLGLLGDAVSKQYQSGVDLAGSPSRWSEALGGAKLPESLVLKFAEREDLPASVWDEYYRVLLEFQRCHKGALLAFDLWDWHRGLREGGRWLGRPQVGPKRFNLTLLVPYKTLVANGLGSLIQVGLSKESAYKTLCNLDTDRILPKDATSAPKETSKEERGRFRKPKAKWERSARDSTERYQEEIFDNAALVMEEERSSFHKPIIRYPTPDLSSDSTKNSPSTSSTTPNFKNPFTTEQPSNS